MKLTIYFDGQFYIGLIENKTVNTLKAYRHFFGKEPTDHEILEFIYYELQDLIDKHEQQGISVKKDSSKKINPKRLQRKVAKEMKKSSISSKAQEALKAEYEHRKKEKAFVNKRLKEERKDYIRRIKIQKSKDKHKGR